MPEIEDRPLAVCDFRSIDPEDLIAADRVLPDRVGEVYYLRHKKDQEWHWIERQTWDECWVMVMFDTMAGPQAKCKWKLDGFTNALTKDRLPACFISKQSSRA